MQQHGGAEAFPFGFFDGVAVNAGGFPFPRLVGAEGAARDRDMIAYHERGIEAHAELAYNIDLFSGLIRRLALFEIERAALCDGAEVLLQLLTGHAAAVVAHLKRARLLIGDEPYLIGIAGDLHAPVGQRAEIELVYRVACV